MKQVIVRYQVKPERVAENRSLVERVYAALAATRPANIRYATLEAPDGWFTHLAFLAHGATMQDVPAFREFIACIRDRCLTAPATETVSEVGSYGMFAP